MIPDEAQDAYNYGFDKGYNKAREEMLKEIPCPQMTNSSISECVCEWCKSFKEEKLGEGEKK